jgi:hypothetical protein
MLRAGKLEAAAALGGREEARTGEPREEDRMNHDALKRAKVTGK